MSPFFSHGGADHEAERLGMPFLGEVPLTMMICEMSNGGRPLVAVDPDGRNGRAYRNIAGRYGRRSPAMRNGLRQ